MIYDIYGGAKNRGQGFGRVHNRLIFQSAIHLHLFRIVFNLFSVRICDMIKRNESDVGMLFLRY